MNSIGQYLLSVTATAMIGGIAVNICDGKAAHSMLVRLISGLLLALAVVSPLVKIELSDLSAWTLAISEEADALTQEGILTAQTQERSIIKTQVEAYILDKAASLNMDIHAEVTISNTDPPVPVCVSLSGEASPYAKARLKQYLAGELGIPEEYQQWE